MCHVFFLHTHSLSLLLVEQLKSLIIFLCVYSPFRRSVIEAVYNRLNPYREEDGVSVSICDGWMIKHSHTNHILMSWGHITHLEISAVLFLSSLSWTHEFEWYLKSSYSSVDSSRLVVPDWWICVHRIYLKRSKPWQMKYQNWLWRRLWEITPSHYVKTLHDAQPSCQPVHGDIALSKVSLVELGIFCSSTKSSFLQIKALSSNWCADTSPTGPSLCIKESFY